jgi:hypothetical protein
MCSLMWKLTFFFQKIQKKKRVNHMTTTPKSSFNLYIKPPFFFTLAFSSLLLCTCHGELDRATANIFAIDDTDQYIFEEVLETLSF